MSEKLDEDISEPRQEAPPEEKATDFYIPGSNFVKLDRRLYDYYMPLIGSIGVMLYGVIGRLYNKEKGYAFPSLDRLEESTGLARNSIKKYLRILAGAEKGYEHIKLVSIKRSNRKGQSTRYILRPPCVTQEVLEALERKGCRPLRGSIHLVGVERANKGSSVDPQKNKESANRGQQMTPKSGKGSTDDTLGSNGDPYSGQSLTPKESKIKESKKREQQQVEPDPALLPDEQESARSKNFVDDSSKDLEQLTQTLCEISGMSEEKSKREITKLVAQHDPDVVVSQIANLRAHKAQRDIKNPIGWLIAACRENYPLAVTTHSKMDEWEQALRDYKAERAEVEGISDPEYFQKRRISKEETLQHIDAQIVRLRELIIRHGGQQC